MSATPLAGNRFDKILAGGDKLGLFNYFGKDPSKWPTSIQEGLGFGLGMKFLQKTPEEEAATLERLGKFQVDMLREQQKLGKESIDYARDQVNKFKNQQALRDALSRAPQQIASIFNPLADPSTAAMVLGMRQRGMEGYGDIVRSIPGLQPASFAMPSRTYFG